MSKLDNLSSEIEDLLLPCLNSTAYTATTLFSEHITRPFCSVHTTILDLLDDDTKRLVAIAAPRGFGKTTLIGLCFTARKALFRFVPYIVYISATQTEAAAKVKTLARELLENEMVRSLFGDVKGVKWAEEKGEIELIDGTGKAFCFIQAKGAGNQIRGLKWGKHRPGLFLVDDLEDKEEAKSEQNRAKLKKWFFGDLMGAMDNSDASDSRLVMIGTIVHQDSLLSNLIDEKAEFEFDNPDDEEAQEAFKNTKETFHTVRLEACNDQFESVWPEFISTESIRNRAEAYRRRGLLDIFYMEFRNIVIAGEEATFQQSMFRYYAESSKEFRIELKTQQIENVVIIDPAKTANTSSAFTAIVGVGFNSISNRIYFRDCLNKRLKPDEIFKEAVDMALRLKTHVIGVEVTGLDNFITYPFRQYITTRNVFIEIVEIKAIKDKDLRIGGLAPFYRANQIYHNEDIHVRGPLESQLLSFPYSKFRDVMDCFANIVKMFDLGNRNFSTTQMYDEKSGLALSIEDEYEMLRIQDRNERQPIFGIV